jgi:8-oxo-(d)GTP phosphatase
VVSEPVIRAAGAVLWRRRGDGTVEFALVHRPLRQDWSLPKGKLESGEHAVTAAVREVLEETGHRVALGRPLTTLRYLVDGQRKQVRYWSANADRESAELPALRSAAATEIDDVVWLAYDQAVRQLTYPHDARLLRDVAKAAADTVPLVLLRHAKAVKRAAWEGTIDHARPLDARGTGQARRLVPMLDAFGVSAVVSSDATRCRDTVLPFARAHDLEVREDPALSEEGHAAQPKHTRRAARALLADPAAVLVCSHRPVFPDLLAEVLVGWDGPQPRPLGPGAFLVFHRDLRGTRPRVVAVERHRP